MTNPVHDPIVFIIRKPALTADLPQTWLRLGVCNSVRHRSGRFTWTRVDRDCNSELLRPCVKDSI